MVKDAYDKSVPDEHWAMFDLIFGGPTGTYIVFTPMKSLAEMDQMMSHEKKFMAAMGEDGMKKLDSLAAAAIESREINLFAFNPRMSYAPPEWIKADPEFWKPQTMTAGGTSAKKPAEVKPAAKSPTGQ